MTIYTIGYQALGTPEKLQAIAAHLDCTVIDCRCTTRSRIAGFGGLQLKALLGERYVHMGDGLGGRGQTSVAGLACLLRYEGTENCLLMCMEAAPWECHRHTDICLPHFPEARHIFMNGLYSPADVEAMVATEQPVAHRGTVFPEATS